VRRLIFPSIVMDATDMVRPLVLRRGDHTVAVFVAESEQPALAWAKAAPVVLHGYYFTWDTRPRSGLSEAVAGATGGAPIRLDAAAPAALYETLAKSVDVAVTLPASLPPVHAFRLPAGEVDARWDASDSELRAAARRAAKCLEDEHRDAVVEGVAPSRFTVLDATLQEAGLDGVLATSPLHVQALTALSFQEIARARPAALHLRGEPDVIVLAESESLPVTAASIGRYADLPNAIVALASGRIGYEELHLSIGLLRFLSERYSDFAPASETVRRWEDRMAAANAPAFLLASLSVVQGMDFAIQHAHALRDAGEQYTEEDLAVAYRSALERFAASLEMTARILPYFEIIQAGERTLYPAMPSSFPITAATQTIKFDMGTLVVDRRGLIRGCSDLARTCAFGPQAAEMNAALDAILRDDLPRGIRPGRSGGEVYASGVAALKEHEPRFRALGFLPSGTAAEGYARDCGHGLARQTPCTVRFAAGVRAVLEDGMMACAELVWPHRRNVFAVEDAWFLDGRGGVNLTRHTGWVWDQ
jgi:Xaa-Pro aminopeptidase